LMSTNSVVVKSTIFPEWYVFPSEPFFGLMNSDHRYTDRIQPCELAVEARSGRYSLWLTGNIGVHYVPVKADLTDLYDVLTFFRGGHDDLARNIAVAGKDWSKTFWRKEDMVSYQFRSALTLFSALFPKLIVSGQVILGIVEIDGTASG